MAATEPRSPASSPYWPRYHHFHYGEPYLYDEVDDNWLKLVFVVSLVVLVSLYIWFFTSDNLAQQQTQRAAAQPQVQTPLTQPAPQQGKPVPASP